MPTPSAAEGVLQWDSLYNILDQSMGTFDVSAVDLPLPDFDWLNDQSVQFATSSTPSPAEQVPYLLAPESKVQTPKAVHNHVEPKATRARKRRPKPNLEQENMSKADRRRNQVRLAQQAFRNREKAALADLRRDVDDLKSRLIGLQSISDDLFDIASSISNLPGDTRNAIQSLRRMQGQYRLPLEIGAAMQTTGSERSSSNEMDHILSPNTTHIRTEALINFQQSLSFDMFTKLKVPQPNFDPRTENLSASPLAFSMRLRHEGLRIAYQMITSAETPFPLLCQKFRFCIFSSTRDEIARNLGTLIYESANMSYAANAASIIDRVEPSSHMIAVPESDQPALVDEYIGAEKVSGYLMRRGLVINPGSPFAEFSMASEGPVGSQMTVFDEIRQTRKVRVSVIKLFNEILDRMVCLSMGPGIQPPKIDEAMQSVILSEV